MAEEAARFRAALLMRELPGIWQEVFTMRQAERPWLEIEQLLLERRRARYDD